MALFLITGIKGPHVTVSNLYIHLTYKRQMLAKNPSASNRGNIPFELVNIYF